MLSYRQVFSISSIVKLINLDNLLRRSLLPQSRGENLSSLPTLNRFDCLEQIASCFRSEFRVSSRGRVYLHAWYADWVEIGLELSLAEGGAWGCSNWQLTLKMDFNSSVRCSASSSQRSLPAKRSFKHSI